MHKRTVALQIAGKEYRVRSDADDAWLQHVADCVDETMAQIRDRTGMVDSFDIAMLTCLNLAREVIGHREAQSDSTLVDEGRLKHLTDAAEAALDRMPIDLHAADGEGEALLPLGELSREDTSQGILGSLAD